MDPDRSEPWQPVVGGPAPSSPAVAHHFQAGQSQMDVRVSTQRDVSHRLICRTRPRMLMLPSWYPTCVRTRSHSLGPWCTPCATMLDCPYWDPRSEERRV